MRVEKAAGTALAAVRMHWPAIVLTGIGLYAGLPWLAPVLMRIGWTGPAEAIYTLYSTQCHQMAQRSYFLFGPTIMLSPADLKAAGVPFEPLALRAFLGSPELGWKVAWSDRMTSMYTALFISLLGMKVIGRRLRPLPAWGLAAMLLPMLLDGGTHLISDFSGLGLGFRDTNQWLASLTGGLGPVSFYLGDAWGSFNANMRLLTGALFGLGIAWYCVPRLQELLGPVGARAQTVQGENVSAAEPGHAPRPSHASAPAQSGQ
jgi:uncharacterized membrane protein